MGLFNKKETDEQKAKRLAGNASGIIEMLKHVFTTEKGLDIKMPLLYAAGLAGYACHQAVKATKGSFVKVTTTDGKNYYFGDDVNKYLLENRTSVYSFCSAISDLSVDKINGIVADVSSTLGSDELTILGVAPGHTYIQIKQCWDGIYDNMTAKYCKSPDEWSILYGIVLQNILKQALDVGAPKEEVSELAMKCAIVISKMDDDSI